MADGVNEVQEKLDELAGALHAAHNWPASAAADDLVSCSLSHAAVDDGAELSLDLGKKKKKKKKDAGADAGVGGLQAERGGLGVEGAFTSALLLAWLEGWWSQWHPLWWYCMV